MKELDAIQQELVVPKLRYNSHGNFHYRNCEDILNALKPFLVVHKCSLKVSDDLVNLNDKIYIKGTVTITNENGEKETSNGFALEESNGNGMKGAQLTGSTSSYARKYALNAMFLIDDSLDPDCIDKKPEAAAQEKTQENPTKQYTYSEDRSWLDEGGEDWDNVLNYILDADDPEIEAVMSRFKVSKKTQATLRDMIEKKNMPNN